jgi:hypothetical protein
MLKVRRPETRHGGTLNLKLAAQSMCNYSRSTRDSLGQGCEFKSEIAHCSLSRRVTSISSSVVLSHSF